MQYSSLEISSIFVLFCAFAMGGILKGATGAGSPLVTIPVLAIFLDAKLAVILMCIPNLISNGAQIVQYKNSANSMFFSIKFALSGGIGCLAGTVVLTSMETSFIEFLVGTLTLGYVLVRLLKPKKQILGSLIHILTPLVGLFGGLVQGSCGISAPVALSFLNALNLKRENFIFSISCFFFSMALVQIFTVYFFGLLTVTIVFLGLLSIIPQIAFMPVGNYLTKKFSAQTFDKLILLFLIILSVKILSELIGF